MITITIRGEQGSGKSVIAQAIRETLRLYGAFTDVTVFEDGGESVPDVDGAIANLKRLAPGPRVEILTRQQ